MNHCGNEGHLSPWMGKYHISTRNRSEIHSISPNAFFYSLSSMNPTAPLQVSLHQKFEW